VLVCSAEKTRLYQNEHGVSVFGVQSAGSGHACIPRLSRRNVNALFDFLDQFQPDVMHAHDPVSLSLMGQVWAAMNNVPFVYTAHILPTKSLEFGASRVFDFLPDSWTETMSRRMMNDFLRNCDAVIALNRPAAVDIRRLGYAGTLYTIPNGRDVARLSACKTAEVEAETKRLSFVGFINQRKNQRYLLEVLKHLPRNYRLQLIGETLEPEYGAQLTAWARENSLDNVALVGPVAHVEIPRYLEQSHVFVSASKMEVQSLSVIEALASGTPVVGLSNETIDELVDEQVGACLAQDASPEAFAERVHALCSLPQPEYDQLCANARRRVAHLGWPAIREQTTAAYAELIAHRQAKSDVQIAKIIERISSEEIQEIVVERMIRIKQLLREKVHPHSRLDLYARMAYAKEIPQTTWFYVGLTRLVSSFLSEISST
jgi:glycosyltransferase involved in cell wall biosynthesis